MTANDPILRRCRAVLEGLYGDRLKDVVLYGSTARGEDTDESDVDLMVVLDGPVDAAAEIYRIWDVLYPVQLDSDRLISVMPADAGSYTRREYSVYRDAQDEGVPIERG